MVKTNGFVDVFNSGSTMPKNRYKCWLTCPVTKTPAKQIKYYHLRSSGRSKSGILNQVWQDSK